MVKFTQQIVSILKHQMVTIGLRIFIAVQEEKLGDMLKESCDPDAIYTIQYNL